MGIFYGRQISETGRRSLIPSLKNGALTQTKSLIGFRFSADSLGKRFAAVYSESRKADQSASALSAFYAFCESVSCPY